MGLDSVEIVMGWEEAFGISIPDTVACDLITPRHAIDYICGVLAVQRTVEPCLSMRVFHRLRRALHEVTGTSLKAIRPDSKLRTLFPRATRLRQWRTFKSRARLKATVDPWSAFPWGSWTVEDLVSPELHGMANSMKPGRAWTRSEVREVVRATVRDQVGITKRFSDHDEFVRDLGVD